MSHSSGADDKGHNQAGENAGQLAREEGAGLRPEPAVRRYEGTLPTWLGTVWVLTGPPWPRSVSEKTATILSAVTVFMC